MESDSGNWTSHLPAYMGTLIEGWISRGAPNTDPEVEKGEVGLPADVKAEILPDSRV